MHLNNITTLKRYCISTWNIKKRITKTSYHYDRIFVSDQNFIIKQVKLFKIAGFIVVFLQNSRFFSLDWHIPGLMTTLLKICNAS